MPFVISFENMAELILKVMINIAIPN
jgi:hypothetical protein